MIARLLVVIVLVCALDRGADASQDSSGTSGAADESSGEGGVPSVETTHHGMYGLYPMNREASGTSWRPDSTPMEGIHWGGEGWTGMLHGFVTAVHQEDRGPRGSKATFSTNMLLLRLQRRVGRGTLGFRFMGSLEAAMGRDGYPVLLQTGETADGQNPLFDRQHPHDALMELAVTYSGPLADGSSLFAYLPPVGEPAIGPSVFMHRASGVDNPIAPISHHWLDSTHVTFGVVTVGFVRRDLLKLEGSVFNGREPDQERWAPESPRLDSYALRMTLNPHPDWSFQGSLAQLTEPEQLHQGLDIFRLSASATYNRRTPGGKLAYHDRLGTQQTGRHDGVVARRSG